MSDFDPLDATLSPPLAEETARALRLRHLIGVAELGTWELEFATGKVERSERTRRIIGLRPEDGTRLDAWRERIHYADRERTLRAFEVACEPSTGEGRFAAEYRVVHDDGAVHWVSDRGWIEFEGHGAERRATRAVGVVADVTARTIAAQRLAVEHEVSRILARSSGFDDAIPAVLTAILNGMDACFCGFWLPEPDGRAIRCVRLVTRDEEPAEAGTIASFVETTRAAAFPPGHGLPGRAWASGKAAWIGSLAMDPSFPRTTFAIECGLRSGMAMPVPGESGSCLGVIEWFSREPVPHDRDLLAMMDALGAEVGQFLMRTRAEQARRESDERHQALYEAGRLLGDTLDTETIYERLRTIVSRTLPIDGLVVSSFDETRGLITCEHAWSDGKRLDPRGFPPLPFNPSAGMQSEVIAHGEARLFRDVKARARNPQATFYQVDPEGRLERITGEEEQGGARCAIMVPLLFGGRVTGVVQVMSDVPGTYGEAELGVLTAIVQQFGVALQNARLYRRAMAEVAERKLAEDAVRHSEQALLDADRRKDEFLATLAHELRNPLAPVRNSLELMRLAGTDHDLADRALATMERQIAQMVRLIDDLLDVSRITRNRLELRRRPVDLAPIVLHAVEATRPLFEQARHELSVVLPPEPVRLDADPARLTQVFGNLLTNACKYTEPGGRVWIIAERQDDVVLVRVKDTGIGIPPEQIHEVFDLFAQVDRSLERAQGGLGIGLSLVRRIVEMHDGGVTAHSAGESQGSEFVVRLPLLVDESGAVPNGGIVEPGASSAPALRGRILVVDDNLDGAESLALLLQRTGATTRTAHDGHEAVVVAQEFRPDVILLDLGLPKMNGYEACRRIRDEAWGRDIVIVALTGWGQDEDRRRSTAAGFDGHLVKPVEHAALASLLDSLSRYRGDETRPG